MSSAAAVLSALLISVSASAGAVGAGALLGQPLLDLKGEQAGTVEDLIVDVRDRRVLYVVVESPRRFHTVPIRALGESPDGLRVDLNEAGEIARTDDPRLRSAARLIGQPLEHPGGERIGTIADFHFDPARGRIENVVVSVEGGRASFPPSVLAHGRFPPLTRWQAEHPPAQDAEDAGLLRREPSEARQRLHDHQWR